MGRVTDIMGAEDSTSACRGSKCQERSTSDLRPPAASLADALSLNRIAAGEYTALDGSVLLTNRSVDHDGWVVCLLGADGEWYSTDQPSQTTLRALRKHVGRLCAQGDLGSEKQTLLLARAAQHAEPITRLGRGYYVTRDGGYALTRIDGYWFIVNLDSENDEDNSDDVWRTHDTLREARARLPQRRRDDVALD